ncbi:MAG: TIGR03936 family radical SAM-associated protein [Coriobacteriia bacterium]|nr:TIGR03936 family radical SAM-associated protein [Coriobacteriia bacterium]MCL2537817.1 TIGR03936 family radical SAM-associated protein [Coriobacteriia bacterium]
MTNTSFFRLRVQYAKAGRGRFLSHLEVQRALTRMVRRAGLPFAVSQGFNPQMRLASGPALSVAMGSSAEYFDITLTDYLKPMDALRRLKEVQSPLLPVQKAGYVGTKEPSLSAAITLQDICVTIEGNDASSVFTQEALEAGLAALRARDTLEVEHKGKTKVFDSATHVPKDVTVVAMGSTVQMTLTLRISQSGSVRPDALLAALWHAAGVPAPDSSGHAMTRGMAPCMASGTASGTADDFTGYVMSIDRTGLFAEDPQGAVLQLLP